MNFTTETFFRAEEAGHEQLKLPATLFNRCVLLLNHSATGNVFVPVRSMQYQAVIDADEIIFVDNQAYAVQDGNGGRLIVLSWKVPLHSSRDSLNEPVPIEVVYYVHNAHNATAKGTHGGFSSGLNILPAEWIARGSSSVAVSPTGWPVGSGSPPMSHPRCVTVWTDVLTSPPPANAGFAPNTDGWGVLGFGNFCFHI